MTRKSVVDRATVRDVFRLAGMGVPDDWRRLVNCPLHADTTPSCRFFDNGFVCFGCGRRGGLLDLIVALGLAYNRAEAAQWLEARLA